MTLCVAVCRSVLQCICSQAHTGDSVCCGVLQCVAVCCSVFAHRHTHYR